MPGNRQDIEEKLRRLRDSYASELPDKICKIDQAWRHLLENGSDIERLRLMIRLCHNLAGSAASFGFPEVTRTAREIEHHLVAVEKNRASLTPTLSQQINRQLITLKEQAGCPG